MIEFGEVGSFGIHRSKLPVFGSPPTIQSLNAALSVMSGYVYLLIAVDTDRWDLLD